MNIRRLLEERLSAALCRAAETEGLSALVAPASRPEFGDYQANGVMPAARSLKTNPRKLAEKVIAAADVSDLAEPLDIAGPGFINITLNAEWLGAELGRRLIDERLGTEAPAAPQRVVVDYSGPNLAKEMHVGHLRSTIIGDALARTLDFLGHEVIRQNHVGDWGTQFGMLVAFLDVASWDYQNRTDVITNVASIHIPDLEEFYRQAKTMFDSNPEFANASRKRVVKLQGGDPYCLERWKVILRSSLWHCKEVYKRLGVLLKPGDVRGESAYNDDLPEIIKDLDAKGLLIESDGAQCVFLDEFRGKDGNVLPVIVRKSDGGYLYATTDLAAIRYRVGELRADRVLYVHDARQALHFRQVFAVARKAGFAPDNVRLEHIPFGTMMGKDNRPFKTRQGGTAKLMDLLDEAERQALALINAKNPDLPEDEKRTIARKVGIGAVKYADLSQNRASDYVFSFDKMLALDGNTAPYMQYAYARIRSIFRKDDKEPASRDREGAGILLEHPAERALGLKLIQFPDVLQTVADECLPHLLCAYLYDLAVAFTSLYESCPILKSPDPIRSSRLALCELTAKTIKKGLELLGIETVDQM